jgi:cohesin domain-containing protein/PEP-CTERM motif-containing protein
MKAMSGMVKSGVVALGLWCVGSLPAWGLPLLSLSATQAGSVVQVEVTASGATNLYAYQFSLNFDPGVLHATTVSEGPFLATGGATFFDAGTTDNAGGQVSFVFDTLLSAVPGVSGSGVLAVIDFSVQRWRTLTTLSLTDVLALDAGLNVLPTQTQALQLQVPEPGMLALLAIGLLTLTLSMRRQGRA